MLVQCVCTVKPLKLSAQVAGRLQAALHAAPWSLRLRSAAARAFSDAGPETAGAAARLWPLRPPLRILSNVGPGACVGDPQRSGVGIRIGRQSRVGGALAAGDGADALAAELQAG